MESTPEQLEITGVPPYVGSWSAVGLPGFIIKVLNRWQRNYGSLPSEFRLVACPQVEVNAVGGLPSRVRELTDSRVRILHFTGCHKPYLIILLLGDDAEARRAEIQKLLSWSEGYQVEFKEGVTQLRFIEAIEENDDDIEFETEGDLYSKDYALH
jgi:hypothetical protein